MAQLCAQLRSGVFGGRPGPETLSSVCALLRALGSVDETTDAHPAAQCVALPWEGVLPGEGVLRGRVRRWDDGSRRSRYAPGNAVAVHPDYLAVLVAVSYLVGVQPAQVHEHVLVLEAGLVQVDTALAEDVAPAGFE